MQWFEDAYAAVLDAVGFLADAFDAVVGAVTAVLSSLDAVVVVPVAYLTVALVVLGHKLADERGRTARPRPRTERRKGVLRSIWADVRERFSALVDALRLLASAGLGPMLVFCLTMLVVSRVPVLVSHAARQVTGPMATDTWLFVAPLEAALGLALSLTLTVPLLAAASTGWSHVVRRSSPGSTPRRRPGSGRWQLDVVGVLPPHQHPGDLGIRRQQEDRRTDHVGGRSSPSGTSPRSVFSVIASYGPLASSGRHGDAWLALVGHVVPPALARHARGAGRLGVRRRRASPPSRGR